MSKEIVRAVSRQLDHYLRVQRLEDGFDQSGVTNPAPLHPPLWDASGSLISARRLHDKPLKHQFSDRRLRARLRRMHPDEDGKETENDEEEDGDAEVDSRRGANSDRTAASAASYARRIEAGLGKQRPLVLPQYRAKSPLRGGGASFLRAAPPIPCSRRERDTLVRNTGEILTYLASGDDNDSSATKTTAADDQRINENESKRFDEKNDDKMDDKSSTKLKLALNDGPAQDDGHGVSDSKTVADGSKDDDVLNEVIAAEPQVVHTVAAPIEGSFLEASEESPSQSYGDDEDEDFPDLTKLAPGPHCYEYIVSVTTGDRVGAGTRHPVRLTLCGDRGASQPAGLSNSLTHRRQFARGRTDKFVLISQPNVGRLRCIKVEHLVDDAYSHWFLESVDVVGPSGEKWKFPCNSWLSAKSIDRRTARWLRSVEAADQEEVDVDSVHSEENYE